MKIYHIVAVAAHNVIGKNNALPWHFSEDMKFFKQKTMGSTVIMGRKTWESLGKPLPGRENFVLSKSLLSLSGQAGGQGARVFSSLGKALGEIRTPEAFVIGGAELYRQTLPFVDGVFMTRIPGEYDGDAFYPSLPGSFVERSRTLLREDPRIETVYYENPRDERCSCCG